MEVVPVVGEDRQLLDWTAGQDARRQHEPRAGDWGIDGSTLKLAPGSSQVTEGLMQLQASTDALAAGAKAQSGSQTITDNLPCQVASPRSVRGYGSSPDLPDCPMRPRPRRHWQTPWPNSRQSSDRQRRRAVRRFTRSLRRPTLETEELVEVRVMSPTP